MIQAEEAWLRKRRGSPALRVFLIVLGALTLALGTVGILIPVLPTTPFLLVSAWSWLRSSDKLYRWLVRHKVLGTYIRNYLIHKAVTRKARRLALVFLWMGLGISFWLVPSLHVRIVLVVVGVAVSAHLLTLRTIAADAGTQGKT
jgi:hypothetical protein